MRAHDGKSLGITRHAARDHLQRNRGLVSTRPCTGDPAAVGGRGEDEDSQPLIVKKRPSLWVFALQKSLRFPVLWQNSAAGQYLPTLRLAACSRERWKALCNPLDGHVSIIPAGWLIQSTEEPGNFRVHTSHHHSCRSCFIDQGPLVTHVSCRGQSRWRL